MRITLKGLDQKKRYQVSLEWPGFRRKFHVAPGNSHEITLAKEKIANEHTVTLQVHERGRTDQLRLVGETQFNAKEGCDLAWAKYENQQRNDAKSL